MANKSLHLGRARPLLVVALALTLFISIFVLRESNGRTESTLAQAADSTSTTEPGDPSTTTTPVQPDPNGPPPTSFNTRVGYLVSNQGALLRPEPGVAGRPIAGGIVFPILGELGNGYRVLDSCNREGWLAADDVTEGLVPAEREDRFDHAVFVIDPGHGLPDLGAVGPTRLFEATVNLDVASRLAELLEAPRDIDWATGRVTAGTTIPAAGAVVMTRSPDGPNGGDYELSLTFRATVANSVDATALISIHNNGGQAESLPTPGSEAYVSVDDPESARLGGLIVDELRRELARFDADWIGGAGSGVRSRSGTGGADYYTILDESDSTSVIVEGVYMSNRSEEDLARTDEFRQAYADAVYRALVRWMTTDDNPIPRPEAENYSGWGGGTRDWDLCVVPGG